MTKKKPSEHPKGIEKILNDERFEKIDKFVQNAFSRYGNEKKLRRYFGYICPATVQEREAYCNRLNHLPEDIKDIILNKNR